MNPSQIPKPIIDLANQVASKPVASFSEFISLKLFGKTIARLKAQAENEYDATKQHGEIERRIQEPFIVQIETAKAYRQYSNLGNVLMKATPLISAIENKVEDDNDVFWGLLEHSKEISNEEMQVLIAKIIAGEYNVPGTYSMSTLQTVKMLGKKELKLFERVAGLLVDDYFLPKELFRGQDSVEALMKKMEVDFGDLQTLQSLGLVLPNDMQTTMKNNEKKNISINYFQKRLTFIPQDDAHLDVKTPAFYCLSPVGEQISKHLNPSYVEDYYIWLRQNYKIPHYKLEE
ncbi:MAG: DUF2806 domain-containing protein [Candidatus Brennerbacteria bacterium]|nr:DUF2806 domain-containing protein [Candidatus Brennerbacteria bacterium]